MNNLDSSEDLKETQKDTSISTVDNHPCQNKEGNVRHTENEKIEWNNMTDPEHHTTI